MSAPIVRVRRQSEPVTVRTTTTGPFVPVTAEELRALLADHLLGRLPELQIYTTTRRSA